MYSFLSCATGVSHSHNILCRWNNQSEKTVFNQEVGCRRRCGQKALGMTSFVECVSIETVKCSWWLVPVVWSSLNLSPRTGKWHMCCVRPHDYLICWAGGNGCLDCMHRKLMTKVITKCSIVHNSCNITFSLNCTVEILFRNNRHPIIFWGQLMINNISDGSLTKKGPYTISDLYFYYHVGLRWSSLAWGIIPKTQQIFRKQHI